MVLNSGIEWIFLVTFKFRWHFSFGDISVLVTRKPPKNVFYNNGLKMVLNCPKLSKVVWKGQQVFLWSNIDHYCPKYLKTVKNYLTWSNMVQFVGTKLSKTVHNHPYCHIRAKIAQNTTFFCPIEVWIGMRWIFQKVP